MNFVESLMGGGQQQQDYQDFVNRYEQGHPAEGYDDQEVVQRHQEVASQISPDDYMSAAKQSFDRMSPEERAQFGQYVQQQAQQQGYTDQTLQQAGPSQLQNSGFLSQIAGQMHQQQPGMFGVLLSGGGMGGMMGGGGMGSMLGGGGMGSMLGGGGGGAGSLLSNPMAKAALAGIASFAVKKVMNR